MVTEFITFYVTFIKLEGRITIEKYIEKRMEERPTNGTSKQLNTLNNQSIIIL